MGTQTRPSPDVRGHFALALDSIIDYRAWYYNIFSNRVGAGQSANYEWDHIPAPCGRVLIKELVSKWPPLTADCFLLQRI